MGWVHFSLTLMVVSVECHNIVDRKECHNIVD